MPATLSALPQSVPLPPSAAPAQAGGLPQGAAGPTAGTAAGASGSFGNRLAALLQPAGIAALRASPNGKMTADATSVAPGKGETSSAAPTPPPLSAQPTVAATEASDAHGGDPAAGQLAQPAPFALVALPGSTNSPNLALPADLSAPAAAASGVSARASAAPSAKRSAAPTVGPGDLPGGPPAGVSGVAAQQLALPALPAAQAQPTAGGTVQPAAQGPATPGGAATGAETAEARLASVTAHRLSAGGQPQAAQAPLDAAADATAVEAKPVVAVSVPAEPASVTTGSPASVDPSALATTAPAIAATPVQHGQTSAPAAPQGNAGAAAPSPAAQVAPALVSLAQAPAGGSRLTLRLDPAELGHVQIRIDRAQDAPARVEITAERPETLALLQRDQPQLQRALDQAGVPADGRSLTFHVASQQTGGGQSWSGGGQSWSGAGTSGQSGGGSQSWSGASPQSSEDDAEIGQPQTTSRWLRAGLDITA